MMPGMSGLAENAGDVWLCRTNARDSDGCENRRDVWLSRDDGGDDSRDVQPGGRGGCVLEGTGGQRKSLSWQAWQYILSPCSRKVPFCSWPRQ